MTSQNSASSVSNYMPYPSDSGMLSRFKLVAPVAPGIYGQPGNRLFITCNHLPLLTRLGNEDVSTICLDGGGFPSDVAVAFGLLPISLLENTYSDQPDVFNGCTLLVPHNIAANWKWRTGDVRFGGVVKVVLGSNLSSEELPKLKIPLFIVRMFAALRIAVGQFFLMLLPVLVINAISLLWVVPILFFSAIILSLVWPLISIAGWGRGIIWGGLLAVLVILAGFFKVTPLTIFPTFLPLAIVISFTWLGNGFMGAQYTD